MALRFRTRLTLTISFLVFLTVAALTLAAVGVFGWNMWQMGYDRGEALNRVAHSNIEYGVSMPDRVLKQLDRQMIVQALLTSELVRLAEQGEEATPADIEAALDGVIDRSRDATGEPLVNEFRVTDKMGRSYIEARESEGAFAPEEVAAADSEFMKLLEPGAKPMILEVAPANPDAEAMRYAGVAGANGEHIVQVGASSDLVDSIRDQFAVQNVIDRLMLPEYFTQIAVIDPKGKVIAALDSEGNTGPSVVSAATARRALNYLEQGDHDRPRFISVSPGSILEHGLSAQRLGVLTPLTVVEGEPPVALYVEHRVGEALALLVDKAMLIVIIGGGMFFLGLIVAVLLSRSLAKPIVALSKGAQEFGKGNLNYRLYLKRKDEFQGLAQAFNTMAISLQEYMHELEQETSRRERLESEFRIASEMQQALLPENPPQVEGLELIGWSQPSKEVGGDFYDFFEMGNGCVGVALGDATGKGISAALLITQCSGILRTLAAEVDGPGELLYRTNNAFHKRIGQTHRFVTLFLMCINPANRTLKFASAGHPSPILVNAQTMETRWLSKDGSSYPLGIVPNATFEETDISLELEDTVIVFSDGLTDAQNPDKELYGDDRVETIVRRLGDKPVDTLMKALRTDAERHMNGKEPVDDMTLVGVRVHAVKSVPPLPAEV